MYLSAYLRQHDRQCVSVNVLLWGPGPIKTLELSVGARARRVPRGSKLVWLRLVFYLVGVGCFGSFSILPRRS